MKVLSIVALLALASSVMAEGEEYTPPPPCDAPLLKCMNDILNVGMGSFVVEVSTNNAAGNPNQFQPVNIDIRNAGAFVCNTNVRPANGRPAASIWVGATNGAADAEIYPWTYETPRCAQAVPCGDLLTIKVTNLVDKRERVITCPTTACPASPPPPVVYSPPPAVSPPPPYVCSPPPAVSPPPPYVCSPPPVTVSSPPPYVCSPPPYVCSPPPVKVNSPPPYCAPVTVSSPPPYCAPVTVSSPPPYCAPVTVSSPPPYKCSPPPYKCSPPPVKVYSPPCVASPPPYVCSPPPVKVSSPPCVASPPPYCAPVTVSSPPYCAPVTVAKPPPYCAPVTSYRKPPPSRGPKCGVTKWGKPAYCKPGMKCCTIYVKKWYGKQCKTIKKQECMKKCPKH